jgi:hypothetical protein
VPQNGAHCKRVHAVAAGARCVARIGSAPAGERPRSPACRPLASRGDAAKSAHPASRPFSR